MRRSVVRKVVFVELTSIALSAVLAAALLELNPEGEASAKVPRFSGKLRASSWKLTLKNRSFANASLADKSLNELDTELHASLARISVSGASNIEFVPCSLSQASSDVAPDAGVDGSATGVSAVAGATGDGGTDGEPQRCCGDRAGNGTCHGYLTLGPVESKNADAGPPSIPSPEHFEPLAWPKESGPCELVVGLSVPKAQSLKLDIIGLSPASCELRFETWFPSGAVLNVSAAHGVSGNRSVGNVLAKITAPNNEKRDVLLEFAQQTATRIWRKPLHARTVHVTLVDDLTLNYGAQDCTIRAGKEVELKGNPIRLENLGLSKSGNVLEAEAYDATFAKFDNVDCGRAWRNRNVARWGAYLGLSYPPTRVVVLLVSLLRARRKRGRGAPEPGGKGGSS